ncbi:MAG: zf-HC2 domain-containing protein [Deltaproteobacteria bacterium]|nr:zf-HC2 domain-containing protein [Deltaproteobacteria bacterium]
MKKLMCARAEELLVRDLDAGLTDTERALLETHLTGCAACAELRQEISGLIAALKTDSPADPGEEYWHRYDLSLEAGLREKEINPGVWVLRWKLAAAALCVVLVVLAAREFTGRPDRDAQTLPARALALVEDLREIYGPVEEDRYLSMDIGNDAAFPGDFRIAFLNDGFTNWFEVEDESDNLLL